MRGNEVEGWNGIIEGLGGFENSVFRNIALIEVANVLSLLKGLPVDVTPSFTSVYPRTMQVTLDGTEEAVGFFEDVLAKAGSIQEGLGTYLYEHQRIQQQVTIFNELSKEMQLGLVIVNESATKLFFPNAVGQSIRDAARQHIVQERSKLPPLGTNAPYR